MMILGIEGLKRLSTLGSTLCNYIVHKLFQNNFAWLSTPELFAG